MIAILAGVGVATLAAALFDEKRRLTPKTPMPEWHLWAALLAIITLIIIVIAHG